MSGGDDIPCPACGRRVAVGAWICPFCDHILDASVLGSPEPPEALILGEVSVDPEAFQVMAGEGQGEDGKTHALLVYATGTSARFLTPEGVPVRTPQALPPSVRISVTRSWCERSAKGSIQSII
jgi:hypothetical protein